MVERFQFYGRRAQPPVNPLAYGTKVHKAYGMKVCVKASYTGSEVTLYRCIVMYISFSI